MLSLSLVLAGREVRDTLGDWRLVTPMLILSLIFPLLMVVGIQVGIPYLEQIDPQAAIEKVAIFGAMMAAFFPISFSLVIALESFVGEKERNTLEALLATPLSDAQLFLGKLLAVMVPPVFLSLLALVVYTVGLYLKLGFQVSGEFLLLTMTLSFVEALAMVAGAVVVSSHTASVRASNLLASFIILPMALVVQAEVMLILLGYSAVLWFVLAALTLVAIILVRMGINVFNREEILTRENDELNLWVVVRTATRFWHLLPRATAGTEEPEPTLTLLRLYRRDIPQLLALYRWPLVVVAFVLLTGALLGYFFALAHPLPLKLDELDQFVRRERIIQLASSFTALDIFAHNLRTVILAAVASVFTFGAGGLVMLLSSMGVAGFLVGQVSAAGVAPLPFITAFLLPHGVVEVMGLLVVGAMNLRLGMCIMNPPPGFSFGDSLMLSLVNWCKAAVLFLPLLLLAAYLEAHLTPRAILLLFGSS